MGFFDALFGNKNQIPTVTSILPAAAKNEIMSGRLPILNTDQLFLKRGEKIHFIDKAVNLEEKTVKQYRHYGHLRSRRIADIPQNCICPSSPL